MGFAQSAALRKLASSRRLLMEWLEAAPRSECFCGRLLTASLPRWKTSASVGCSWNVFGRRRFFPGFRVPRWVLGWFVYVFVPGVPPDLSWGRHSEPRRCQVCPGAFFHRFWSDLEVHLGRHFRTCCIVWSIHFRSVFSEACRHALVTISASFWKLFREHFRYVFGK